MTFMESKSNFSKKKKIWGPIFRKFKKSFSGSQIIFHWGSNFFLPNFFLGGRFFGQIFFPHFWTAKLISRFYEKIGKLPILEIVFWKSDKIFFIAFLDR